MFAMELQVRPVKIVSTRVIMSQSKQGTPRSGASSSVSPQSVS